MASLPDYRRPINPTGRKACARDGTRLDDMAEGTVFLGIRTIQERSRRHGAALCCAGAGPGDRRLRGDQVRRVRTHGGNPAERTDTRAGDATARKAAGFGAAAAVPAMLRERT